jgi:hypothetical protein
MVLKCMDYQARPIPIDAIALRYRFTSRQIVKRTCTFELSHLLGTQRFLYCRYAPLLFCGFEIEAVEVHHLDRG